MTTNVNPINLSDFFGEGELPDLMTGYKLAQVVNDALKHHDLKEVPAQMMYNYIKKGYIESVEVEDQKLVTAETAIEWLEGYITKKTTK